MASKLAAIPASRYCPEGEIRDAENEPPDTRELEEIPRHRQLRDELEEDLKIKVAEFESLFSEFRQNIQIVSPDVAAKIDPVFDQLAQGAAAQYRHMTADYLDAKHEDFKNEYYWEQFDDWNSRELSELRSEIRNLGEEVLDRDELVKETQQKFDEYILKKEKAFLQKQEDTSVLQELNEKFNKKFFDKYPKFDVAAEAYIKKRIEAQKKTGNSEKEIYYLRHRVEIFIKICGNKPVDEYDSDDLDRFALDLQYLPLSYTKAKHFREVDIRDIIKINKRYFDRNHKMNWRPLTEKTIRDGYIGRLRTVFNGILNKNRLPSPFAGHKVLIPKTTNESVDRLPLTISNANNLFQKCAKLDRPDDVLLPLLGALTGARIGELAFLQAKDIDKWHEGYVLNLFNGVDDGGITKPRELKTRGAKRYIAIHQKLVDVGFVEWARSQEGFLFPHLHHSKIVDPADTASKRFQRIFRKAEIHDERAQVFHSLRHLYKDMLRDAEVNERTADIQLGHALVGVSANYGKRTLRPKEVAILSRVPLPAGIDFSPYMARKFETLERFDSEAFERRAREQAGRARLKKKKQAKAASS